MSNGGDIYTLFKEDAYRLADSVYGGRAEMESDLKPGHFSRYHPPAGIHPVYVPRHPKARGTTGHVFLGQRDERWKSGRR